MIPSSKFGTRCDSPVLLLSVPLLLTQMSLGCHPPLQSPHLKHIKMAVERRNFQHCDDCVAHREEIARAKKSGSRERLRLAKHRFHEHLALQRGQRAVYYQHRAEAMRPESDCISVIFDKWDSSKTMAPYFARAPHFWTSVIKKRILRLHVLLVLIHGIPKREYFYVFNDSIKGGANVNIEGFRRSLIKHVQSGNGDGEEMRLPSTCYAQFDSAGDNKNQWMLAFFGYLVKEGKFREVFANMLIVGHTHEDVDAEFSIGSRYIYKETVNIKTPQHFWQTLKEAYANRSAVFEMLEAVLDWSWWFGDKSAKVGSEANARACISSIKGIGTERKSGMKRSPHSFWIHMHEGRVVMHYKEYATDPVWLPARKENGVLVESLDEDTGAQIIETDPAGIDLFFKDLPSEDTMRVAPFATQESSEPPSASTDSKSTDPVSKPTDAKAPKGSKSTASKSTASKTAHPSSKSAKSEDLPPKFDKADILAAAKEVMAAARVNAGRECVFDDQDLAEWEKWADETPGTLADIPVERRPKLELPKQGYQSLAPLVTAPRRQVELLVYENRDGSKMSKSDRKVAFADATVLPISVGTIVALKRSHFEKKTGEAPAQPLAPGWNTPFYLGKVLEIIRSGSSSSTMEQDKVMQVSLLD